MSTEWYTPEKETLVDLLYSTTSKGYSNRNLKYAAVHRIAQQFDTTGSCNVVLCVYDNDERITGVDPSLMAMSWSSNTSQPVCVTSQNTNGSVQDYWAAYAT